MASIKRKGRGKVGSKKLQGLRAPLGREAEERGAEERAAEEQGAQKNSWSETMDMR